MTKRSEILMYRIGYALFIALGFYQLLLQKDYTSAASSFGIGLIFDPFDRNQKWQKKPNWQKTILLGQLGIALVLFLYGIFWS